MKRENITPNSSEGYEGVGRFYDLFADNSDIPFFLKYAKEIGSPILDLAAGTGRVSFALAEDGHEIVALEKSPSMLEIAREKLENAKSSVVGNITLVDGDMRKFDLKRKFKLIIIPNSFGHAMTTEDQFATLRCIRNHLSDDGIFILDTYPAALQYEHAEFREKPVLLPDGTTVEREGKIQSDFLKQIMTLTLRYIVRDSKENIIEEVSVESSAALLFNREVNLLVRLSGFEIEKELGYFDDSSYSSESLRRILILKKQ